jgi:hypothetical protein
MIQSVPKIRVDGFTRALLVSKKVLAAVDSPLSLGFTILINEILANNDPKFHWDQLAACSYTYADLPDDINNHRDRLLVCSLLSKFENIFNDKSLFDKAMESFSDAEYQCYLANQACLSGLMDSQLWDHCSVSFDQIKQQVSKVLGRAPSWQSVLDNGGWGPGATFSLPRESASPELKSKNERSVTLRLAKALMNSSVEACECPWFNEPLHLVPGNLVVTVPKNTKTDRTIAIEPGVNSWCQKGIAHFLRKRLLRVGINLNDQTSNSLAALDADQYGLSTLDLKAASDGLPLFVIQRLIPLDWWTLLEASRCDRYSLNKRGQEYSPRDYHKLSSMGNGFTFEIESLIFYACAKTVNSVATFVYGDDIIIERQCYKPLVSLLNVLGFRVNMEKSFHDVYFYESCGMFSYRGVDITPFRLKEGLYGPKDIIVFANKIRYYSHVRNHFDGCWRKLLPSWRMCVDWLPTAVRKLARAPLGAALALFVNYAEAVDSTYSRARGGFTFRALAPVLNKKEDDFSMLLWHRLRSLSDLKNCSIYEQHNLSSGNVVKQSPKPTRIQLAGPDGRLKWVNTPACRYKLTGRLSTEEWYNFGPWQ